MFPSANLPVSITRSLLLPPVFTSYWLHACWMKNFSSVRQRTIANSTGMVKLTSPAFGPVFRPSAYRVTRGADPLKLDGWERSEEQPQVLRLRMAQRVSHAPLRVTARRKDQCKVHSW